MTEVLKSKRPTPVPISMAEATAAATTTTTTTKLAPIVMPSNDRDLPPRRGTGPKMRREREWERKKRMISEPLLAFLLSPTAAFGGVLKCKIQKEGLDEEENVLGYE